MNTTLDKRVRKDALTIFDRLTFYRLPRFKLLPKTAAKRAALFPAHVDHVNRPPDVSEVSK